MTMRSVSGFSQGAIQHDAPEVMMTIFGPRGGMRSVESLDPREALKLGRRLTYIASSFCLCTAVPSRDQRPSSHDSDCPLYAGP